MNFSKFSVKTLLLLILIAGFLLRSINLTVGFPMLYLSNDEAIYHLSALNMIANKTVFSLGNYGPLGAYLQIPFLILGHLILYIGGKVHSLMDMEMLLLTQEGYFMFIPRIISTLFGTLTILSIYKLSLVLFKNKNAALWSSFFCAVSFSLVHVSHLARSWSPALFFSTLVVLFSIYSIKSKKDNFKNALLAFIFSAVTFGFHQIAGIIVVFPLAVILKKHSWRELKSKSTLILVWFILILLFNYLSLGNKIFHVFRLENNLGLALIKTPNYWLKSDNQKILSTLTNSVVVYWHLLLSEGIILLFAIYGFFLRNLEVKTRAGLIAFFLTSLFLSAFVFPPILRYSLPTIVFLPVFAGIAAYRFLRGKNFYFVLIVVLLASFNSIYWNWLISKEPTFDQVRRWTDTNIPAEIPISATFYRTVGYVPSKTASEIVRAFRGSYYARLSNLIGNNDYPYNVRNILYLETFNKDSKVDNLKAGLSVFPLMYVIDAYYQESERLFYMNDNLELVAQFSPTGGKIYKDRIPEVFFDAGHNFPFFILERPGPYFDILKFK